MTYNLFFEQSGTFKNEFKKMGFVAYDYDILNDFNETDYKIDLFDQIKKAYNNNVSIFDTNIKNGDYILAFFPCVRFEAQQIMNYRGVAASMKKWDLIKKFDYNLKSINELAYFNEILNKLCIVCMRKKIKLVIENPYTTQGFLYRYWVIPPAIIDYDRTKDGDHFRKPTQYFFINCKPKNNYVNDKIDKLEIKKITETHNKVERSLISSQYARRFIKRYIIDYDYKMEAEPAEEKSIFEYLGV